MAIINTGLLTKGLRSEFFNRFEAAPAHYRQLATRVVSTTHTEIYRWLGSVPQMREWADGRLARGLRSESYSLENLKYEATLEVDRDEISDDQTGQIRVRVGELADRAATHKDYLIAQLLANGDQAGYLSYDGVPFFSASHVSGASGTQSNVLSSSASVPSNPSSDEFRSSLVAAVSRLLAQKDDQGEPMALTADGLYCVVPPNLYFPALESVNGTLAGGGTNVLDGAARVVAFPWLTSTDTWYLLKTNAVVRPFIFQDREPIEFTALADDSEDAFKREKYLFGVRARYRMAYGYWQYAVQATLAES
ncbi:MAG: Mu-like prophage major head subunit gpT family protein [Phycisphaerales bacterium]|nr:Mu-like prophage major head subunit gpT family protein [Phycisphaerales bacterium]